MKTPPLESPATAVGPVTTFAIRPTDTSMLPLLRPGQVVAVELFTDRTDGPALRLCRGDLLYWLQDDPKRPLHQRRKVVHRLLKRARSGQAGAAFRTRGDGWNALDSALESQHILGRVTAFRDEGGWWSLRGGGARWYARCVAWHDLFWAAVGLWARPGDRLLGRLGLRPLLLPLTRGLDRLLLGLAHRIWFRALHSRTERPDAPAPAGGPGPRGSEA